MNFQMLDAETWPLAMTLSDRLQSQEKPFLDPLADAQGDSNYRLNLWRSQDPFDRAELWSRCLALHGLTNEEFIGILSESASAVRSRFTELPAWVATFREAFCTLSTNPDALASPLSTARAETLTGVAEPLVRWGVQRLKQGIACMLDRFPDAPFGVDLADELHPSIYAQLKPLLVRTMALELNVARLEGTLVGATSEERFDSFFQSLRNPPTALRILAEYPVLARQLMEAVIQFVDRNVEALERLCIDWEDIQSTLLCGQHADRLMRLISTSGDKHRGGQAVLFAEFESGARVVYKPRSLAVEMHFQRLLEWLNDHGALQPFRILKVIERGEYGWVEFVSAEDCKCAAEVHCFYQRQGAYLAILYALEATDFHHENLLAAGEHPVLVDLEALFHPRVVENQSNSAMVAAERELNNSVLRVGLLPIRLWANDEGEGVDFSGLSTEGEQMTPFPVPVVEGDGTDQMRLVSKRVSLAPAAHRPGINGFYPDLGEYSDSILEGFTHMYRLLVRHREDLLDESGPLYQFRTDEIRVVLLPTQTYAILLRESFHPDVLRDALDRDRLFHRLWAVAAGLPGLERLMMVQLNDLSNRDVPIFTAKPESRDIWSSSKEQFTNYLDECPFASVRKRLLGLTEGDLSQQLWIIRATLASLSRETDKPRMTGYVQPKPEEMARPERLINAAKRAGDWLDMQARHGDDDAAWIGLTLGRHRRWALTPAGVDLYDGLPGIALFLAELGAITGEDRYTRLAEGAVNSLLRTVEKNTATITSIGGFTGWGGLVYALSRMGGLWRREDLWHEAENASARIEALIQQDNVLDIIGGAAGSIGPLMGLYREAGSQSALETAIQCGEHLLRRAQYFDNGIALPAAFGSTRALTGFSHGAAGIAWAFQQLADATGEQRFSEAAARALAYERGLFNPQYKNWPDLRDEVRGADFCVAWCHGAPGIGLARLSTLRDGDDVATAEIEAALQTTVSAGVGRGHCLCHGDLGNLDLLIEAARWPRWSACRREADHFAAVVVRDIEHNGWRCGMPLDLQSPGLMTGIAGIGYQLLRLADPERVPSVLVFNYARHERMEIRPGCV